MLALNAALPFLTFRLLTAAGVPTLTALCLVAVFPVLGIVSSWRRTRRLNAIGGTSLLVIILGLAAALVSGDPRVILAKESLISGGWSAACLVSLTGLGGIRPLMFYLARQLATGGDPEGMARVETLWAHAQFRRLTRQVTAVWAVVYFGEAVARVIMALTLPADLVLAISPLLLGGVTLLMAVWTIRRARRARQQLAAAAAVQPVPQQTGPP